MAGGDLGVVEKAALQRVDGQRHERLEPWQIIFGGESTGQHRDQTSIPSPTGMASQASGEPARPVRPRLRSEVVRGPHVVVAAVDAPGRELGWLVVDVVAVGEANTRQERD